MNRLDDLIARAIPIAANACRIIRGKKEWQRAQMRERLTAGKDLHLVPEWVVKEYNQLKL